jgi:hypothetical protein
MPNPASATAANARRKSDRMNARISDPPQCLPAAKTESRRTRVYTATDRLSGQA